MSRTLYNCKTAADGWTFVKFDPDFNISAIYTVKTRTEKPQMVCDCPGWPHKSICKHTRMVNTFALAGAIDTSRFYCYETQTWHQPIQHDGENDPTAEKAAKALEVVPAGPTTSSLAPPTPEQEAYLKGLQQASPTPLRRRV